MQMSNDIIGNWMEMSHDPTSSGTEKTHGLTGSVRWRSYMTSKRVDVEMSLTEGGVDGVEIEGVSCFTYVRICDVVHRHFLHFADQSD